MNPDFKNLPTAEAKLEVAEKALENSMSPENIKLAEDIISLEDQIFSEFAYEDRKGRKEAIHIEALDEQKKILFTSMSNIRNEKIKKLESNVPDMKTFVHRLYLVKKKSGDVVGGEKVWSNLAGLVGVDNWDVELMKSLRGTN